MACLQTSYTPSSHLGTPLDKVELSPFARQYKGSFADRVFTQSLQGIESISEREASFPRFRPVAQGTVLTSPPTGGFSSPISVIVGADGEAMYRANDPTYFLASDREPVTEVGSGLPLTGGRPGAELVYRQPNGKLRSEVGASTVVHAEREAAQGRALRRAAYQRLAGDGVVTAPFPTFPAAVLPHTHNSQPQSLPLPVVGAAQQSPRASSGKGPTSLASVSTAAPAGSPSRPLPVPPSAPASPWTSPCAIYIYAGLGTLVFFVILVALFGSAAGTPTPSTSRGLSMLGGCQSTGLHPYK